MLFLKSTCFSVYLFWIDKSYNAINQTQALIYVAILYLFEWWGHVILDELQLQLYEKNCQ